MIYGVTHFNCIGKQTQTEIRRQNEGISVVHFFNSIKTQVENDAYGRRQ
jgi:hypothetical protein